MDSGVFEVGETVESAIPTISNPSVEMSRSDSELLLLITSMDHITSILRFKTNPSQKEMLD